MKASTDPNRRRLIFWWVAGGLGFLAVMTLLFWAGLRSGQSPEVQVPQPPPAAGPEETPTPQPPAGGQDLPPPTGDPEEDLPPGGALDLTPLPVVGEEADPRLPDDWDELDPVDKISLNPLGCDLSREAVDLEDGSCRRRSTLSSKSVPWNPMAINSVSTTEIDRHNLQIACYNQDLSGRLNQPDGLAPAPGLVDQTVQPPTDNGINLDNNRGFQHCVLRVILEMTSDDFYFASSCRSWRAGFVKLVAADDQVYDSLATPGPDVVCAAVRTPVGQGQQIEQVFLFEVSDADLNLRIEAIRFDLIEPNLAFSGNFGFIVGGQLGGF